MVSLLFSSSGRWFKSNFLIFSKKVSFNFQAQRLAVEAFKKLNVFKLATGVK